MRGNIRPKLQQDDLRQRLARTEEYILEAKRLIHGQRIKVYSLQLRGADTLLAEHRLDELLKSQTLYEEQWNALLRELRR